MGARKETASEGSGRTKAIMDKLFNSRHSNTYLAMIILLIAMIPRVFYISIGVLPNGVDEGVDIMAGRMWNFGSELYSQINTVQAPLMLSVYGLIEADPVIFRLFSTICSLVIIAFVMWVVRPNRSSWPTEVLSSPVVLGEGVGVFEQATAPVAMAMPRRNARTRFEIMSLASDCSRCSLGSRRGQAFPVRAQESVRT